MTRDWSRLRLGALMLLLAALLAGLPTTTTSFAQDATETPADGGPTGLLTVTVSYCVRDDQADGTVTIVAQATRADSTVSPAPLPTSRSTAARRLKSRTAAKSSCRSEPTPSPRQLRAGS